MTISLNWSVCVVAKSTELTSTLVMDTKHKNKHCDSQFLIAGGLATQLLTAAAQSDDTPGYALIYVSKI